ncbi:MAG: YihY/virulence factor BrkB family protein [Desulfosalsimonadaceae bacterium]|nr:YihY/virulence factor BrkB family protein [Desulfosalsimonadaceae bacterium]
MDGVTTYRGRISDFLKNGLWHDPKDAGRLYVFFYQTVRVILLTIHGLKNRMILLRASALSYSTLLAIVPLLAIIVSMLKGLGFHARLEQVLISSLAAEHEDLITRIIGYISATDFKALGAFGTAILIYASVTMISNVERAFNELWGVPRHRTVTRKISNYISFLFLGPFLMVLSTAIIASLSANTVVSALTEFKLFEHFSVLFSRMASHAILWFVLTVIYILLPNTRVKFVPALIAGVICGSLWKVAFGVYMDVNINVAHYNTIYGTFAVLPVFIAWLYFSWMIVLMGAQLSCAIQNIRSYQQEMRVSDIGCDLKEEVALYIMLHICSRFHHGLSRRGVDPLSDALAAPVRLVREITRKLCDGGLLQEIPGDDVTFQPAKNIGLIRVLDVCQAVRHEGDGDWRAPEKERNPALQALIGAKKTVEAEHFGKTTLLDLILGSNDLAKG